MSSPASPPSPTPENASTGESDGNTYAWRYWRIQDAQLASPFAGDILPADSTLHAGCHRPHLPPSPGCQCGVSIYLTRDDVQRAIELLEPSLFAVTCGIAHRPVMRDTVGQLYNHGGIIQSGPPSYRCRAYTVTTIYHTTNTTFDYDVPIETVPDLLDTHT